MMTTYFILIATVLVSIGAFQNGDWWDKSVFYPYLIQRSKEWWRFVTHGFVHADYMHLIFNMLTLFFFGRAVEEAYVGMFGNQWMFPLFYVSALVVAALPDYVKHKDHSWYRSLGASGAVSAVLFSYILLDPWAELRINFIIPIPAILFAVGYLWYSTYMSKQQSDNIAHGAHLFGALYGMLFPMVFHPSIIPYFIEQIQHPRFFN